MKGLAWIREHWIAAAIFVAGVITNALITKIIESNDLEWLKAIWAAIARLFVSLYNGFLSSVPVPVWLLLLVVGLALIPVWHLAKRVRLTPATRILPANQETVLGSVFALEEAGAGRATLANIMRHAGCSRLVAEAALDVLRDRGLIEVALSFNSDNWYFLKAEGRAYLLNRSRTTEAAST